LNSFSKNDGSEIGENRLEKYLYATEDETNGYDPITNIQLSN